MFRSPSYAQLPHIHTLLNDIPASSKQIARLLGITEATLRKYKAQAQAPKPVMLALFWESTWGRSTADIDAFNAAATHYARAEAYKRQNDRLLAQIEQLEKEIESNTRSAANLPIFKIG